MTKICTKCNAKKPLDQFHNNKKSKDGKCGICAECAKAKTIAWAKANPERKAANARVYSEVNKESEKIRKRKSYDANKDVFIKRASKWKEENRERVRESSRVNYSKNLDKERERSRIKGKIYREKNPEKVVNATKIWKMQNRPAIRTYENSIYLNNSLFTLAKKVRARILAGLRSMDLSKNKNSSKIVGITWPDLLKHLENTAVSNYGVFSSHYDYAIDHIVPLSWAETEEEILSLCHYTNLQYLKHQHNFEKSDLGYDPILDPTTVVFENTLDRSGACVKFPPSGYLQLN